MGSERKKKSDGEWRGQGTIGVGDGKDVEIVFLEVGFDFWGGGGVGEECAG